MLSEKDSLKQSYPHDYVCITLSMTVIEMSSGQESGMVERQHGGSFHLRPPR